MTSVVGNTQIHSVRQLNKIIVTINDFINIVLINLIKIIACFKRAR